MPWPQGYWKFLSRLLREASVHSVRPQQDVIHRAKPMPKFGPLHSLPRSDQLWLLFATASLLHFIVISAVSSPFHWGPWSSLGLACFGAGVWGLRRQGWRVAWLGPRGALAFKALLGFGIAGQVCLLGWMIREAHPDENEPVDLVILLGAGLVNNQPSATLERRIATAAEYLRNHAPTPIIVCGGVGRGQTRSEAEAMRDGLIQWGIPAEQISMEAQSTSTDENLRFARQITQREQPSSSALRVLIVTSNYHLGRAKYLARRHGFTPFGLPAPTPWSILPNAALRESLAIIKALAESIG